MRALTLSLGFLLTFPNALVASDGDSKVLAMLKTNSIVQEAVAQAKSFSGAEDCQYTIKSKALRQFEPDTAFDYEAEISCFSTDPKVETTGIVRVRGQLIGDGPQAFKLEIDFAG